MVRDVTSRSSNLQESSSQFSPVFYGRATEFGASLKALSQSIHDIRRRSEEVGRSGGEVKQLAQRSNESADEISKLIAESQCRVQDGVAAGEKTSAYFRQISTAVQASQGELNEVINVTQNQSEVARQLEAELERLRQISNQNHASGDQLSSEGDQLDSLAQQLNECVAIFKTGELAAAL